MTENLTVPPAANTPSSTGAPRPAAAGAPSTSERRLPVFLDLETRSDCDLKEQGAKRYAAHPSTEIVSVVALVRATVIVWTPHRREPVPVESLRLPVMPASYSLEMFCGPALPSPLEAARAAGTPFCAHNAHEFDARVWRAAGLSEPSAWEDTLPWCRASGFPGRLDEVCKRLFGIGKDPQGSALVTALSQRVNGAWNELSAEQWIQLLRYNVQDVLLLAGLYGQVRRFDEPDVLTAHHAINERGVLFDRDLARRLIAIDAEATERVCNDLERITDGAVTRSRLNSIPYLLRWLHAQGVTIPNLQSETVGSLLESSATLSPQVRTVLKARLAVCRIAADKLEKALAMQDDDGRVRNTFTYCGSHPGRWSGRGVQPHNLPKAVAGVGNVFELLMHSRDHASLAAAMPSGVDVSDAVSALVRLCFRAREGHVLCIADYAGIEPRCLAWIAGEERLLRQFRDGGDPYCDLASKIFGRPITRGNVLERTLGKVALLGCGYGMGAEKFAETCRKASVDLQAVGLTAEAVVNAYRDNYGAIAGRSESGIPNSRRQGGLWQVVEGAVRWVLDGRGPCETGRCRFAFHDGDLLVKLPSGRVLCFRNARTERTDWGRPAIVFDRPDRTNERTYGGKLTENIVSAISRDLLAAALVECERQGLPVVLHVHDEIVIEVPVAEKDQALHRLLRIMSTPPAWALGLPIEVEGHCGERYAKQVPAGGLQGRARNGSMLT